MKYYAVIALLLSSLYSIAGPGDTTRVTVHQAVDMTWYGSYDQWGQFPDGSTEYRQILMHYTMGCASSGCSDWDYTTMIELMEHTGDMDSTRREAPSFKVNGNTVDSVIFAMDTTYTTSYNSTTQSTDSSANPPLEIVLYEDTLNPTTPTDTVYAWAAGYYNFYYDSTGAPNGSAFVGYDSIWYPSFTVYYTPFEVVNRVELARVITPYGGYMAQGSNGFNNSWKHKHTFDVTDYAPLLQDSVHLRAFYSGWSSGFSVTLEFEFIEGTPPRPVLDIQNLYKGYYNYVDDADFESNKMPEVMTYLPTDAVGARLRITPTGHGFDNNLNCAEFCPKEYYVMLDGQLEFAELIWQDDCGENPIYPQGGTWVYDRANWCPGGAAKIFEHELTGLYNPGDSLGIDYDIEDHVWAGPQTPGYEMSVQLITYGAPNHQIDAAVTNIMRPSNNENYSRKNPICKGPLIEIKNEGAQTLSTLDIQYGVEGGTQFNYTWNGNLEFMEKAEIELPNIPYPSGWQGSANNFIVQISNPNGGTDEQSLNDVYTTAFDPVDEHQNNLIFEVKTNARPSENEWRLYGPNGNVIFERKGGLSANTIYKDTLYLGHGCYTFEIIDHDGDGLTWWANNDGSGYARIRKVGGGFAKTFKADFGSSHRYQFSTTNNVGLEEPIKMGFEVYPNPSNGQVFLDLMTQEKSEIELELTDALGRVIRKEMHTVEGEKKIQWLTKNLQTGTYYLRMSHKGGQTVKTLVIQ